MTQEQRGREHQTSDLVSEWSEREERERENAAPPIQESALKIKENKTEFI